MKSTIFLKDPGKAIDCYNQALLFLKSKNVDMDDIQVIQDLNISDKDIKLVKEILISGVKKKHLGLDSPPNFIDTHVTCNGNQVPISELIDISKFIRIFSEADMNKGDIGRVQFWGRANRALGRQLQEYDILNSEGLVIELNGIAILKKAAAAENDKKLVMQYEQQFSDLSETLNGQIKEDEEVGAFDFLNWLFD